MTNRALLIGIDDYPGTQNDLNSCIQDTLVLKGLLTSQYNFADSDIKVLHDQNATIGNVREGLQWLIEGAAAGDRRIYFQSSHGYRYPKDGKLIEVLCLYDEFLEDHELVESAAKLPAGVLTVLIDACHSGGLDKVFFPPYLAAQVARAKVFQPEARGAEIAAKSMNEVRSVKLFGRPLATAPAALAKDFARVGPDVSVAKEISVAESELNGMLFAACRADETAAAGTPATNGLSAFTFALTAEYDPTIPVEELHDRVVQRLQNVGMRQTPVLAVRPGQHNLLGTPLIAAGVSTSIVPSTTLTPELIPRLVEMLKTSASQGPVSIAQVMALLQVVARQEKEEAKMAKTGTQSKAVVPEIDWDRLISLYYAAQGGDSFGKAQKGFMPPSPVSKGMEKGFFDALADIDWEQVVTTGLQVYSAVAKSKGFEPGGSKGFFDDIVDVIDEVDWDKVVPIAIAVGTTVA